LSVFALWDAIVVKELLQTARRAIEESAAVVIVLN